MNGRVPLRDLPGREIALTLQRFHWRFETLKEDYDLLMAVRKPRPILTREARYSRRDHVYEAERRLHHYLSGFYSFYSVVTTVANLCSELEHIGRTKNERDQYDQLPSSRVVLGLRTYIQHEDILPLLVKFSEHSDETPLYVLNPEELHMGQGYNEGFEHHYGHLDNPHLRPFAQVEENWPAVIALYEAVRSRIKRYLGEDLQEYEERLEELEEIRDKHVLPELREMMSTEESI
jgi:hypothetical protein